MKRLLVMAALCTAMVAALAAPAFAHNEINPSVIVTGKPTYFTLDAPNESKSDLVKVSIEAPAGTPFGALTNSPAGWTADAAEDKITWSGGSVKPDNFVQFGYEIEKADQPGTLNYTVTETFADGTSDKAIVAVTAKAPPTATAAKPPAKSTNKRANVALGLGVVALLLGIAALVVALNKGKSKAPATASADGGSETKSW
jgi:hypothetical protein